MKTKEEETQEELNSRNIQNCLDLISKEYGYANWVDLVSYGSKKLITKVGVDAIERVVR